MNLDEDIIALENEYEEARVELVVKQFGYRMLFAGLYAYATPNTPDETDGAPDAPSDED